MCVSVRNYVCVCVCVAGCGSVALSASAHVRPVSAVCFCSLCVLHAFLLVPPPPPPPPWVRLTAGSVNELNEQSVDAALTDLHRRRSTRVGTGTVCYV
ncbi:MAG: hypothetical protein P4L40_04985 [Terracidiphilus sp.]|nr:hypothetical protein [Terracidiphilus sp.]